MFKHDACGGYWYTYILHTIADKVEIQIGFTEPTLIGTELEARQYDERIISYLGGFLIMHLHCRIVFQE